MATRALAGQGRPGRAARRPQLPRVPSALLGLLLLWEGSVQLGLANSQALPAPSLLARTAVDLAASGVLLENTLSSLRRVLAGYALAAALGVSLGVLLGLLPRLGRQLTPIVELLRPIPPIAWIPLAILWLGLGDRSAIFIVAVGAFFPIVLAATAAVGAVARSKVDAARSLGAGPRLIVTDVLLPAAQPQILVGLRVGLGTAWTAVIAAEMVGAASGLGYAIQLNRTMLETEAVMVHMIVIGLVGWAMTRLLGGLERRLTRWHAGTLAVPGS